MLAKHKTQLNCVFHYYAQQMSDSDEDLAALDTICAQEYLMFVRDIGYGLIMCPHLQFFESDMVLAADLTSCL